MINDNKKGIEYVIELQKESTRSEIERVVNLLLQTELSEFLNYEKYDYSGYNSGNSRNGYYSRTIHTEYGDIDVLVPRDRNGEFKQQTLKSHSRRTDSLEDTIINLYSKGMTTEDISDMIEKMYGHHYSPASVSNITDVIIDDIEKFHNRTFEKDYLAVFVDATFINVRRNGTVTKEAVLIAIGIDHEGYKEVLDYVINPIESSTIYQEMLLSLRERGLKNIDIIVSDALSGIRDTCLEVYPHAKHQTCWAHLLRNAWKKVKKKDRSEVAHRISEIHQSRTLEEAEQKLQQFIVDYQKEYPRMIKPFVDNPSLFSFFDFPKVSRTLYTTNVIENFNKLLKADYNKKGSFPSVKALEKYVYVRVVSYNNKFKNRKHRNFDKLD